MKKKITKRIFVLLLAAMLVFPLASCDGEYSEANEPTPDTPAVSNPPETSVTVVPPAETPAIPDNNFPSSVMYTTEDTFSYHYSYYEGKSLSTEEKSYSASCAMIIRNVDDLSALSTQEPFAMYDDAFFAKNNLLVYETQSGNGIKDMEVRGAYREVVDGVPIHVFNILKTTAETPAFVYVTLIVELDKNIDLQNGNFGFRYYEPVPEIMGGGITGDHQLRFPYTIIDTVIE